MALPIPFRRLLCACAVAACAAAVAVSGELSPGALLAVGTAGLAVGALALARRAGAGAAPVGRRGLPWLTWVVAALAWEAAALADDDLPAVSDLADPVLAHPGARAAATVAWLAAGLWLASRPGRRG
ncbi:hypothetical protein ACI79D_02045 [Geodermatophilus sp. SYSU D00708]